MNGIATRQTAKRCEHWTEMGKRKESTVVRIQCSCSLSLSLHVITIKKKSKNRNWFSFFFFFYLFIQSYFFALFLTAAAVKCVDCLVLACATELARPLIDGGILCAKTFHNCFVSISYFPSSSKRIAVLDSILKM